MRLAKFLLVALLLVNCAGAGTATAASRKSTSAQQVIYFCNAMLHWHHEVDISETGEINRRGASAERFFQQLSPKQRRQLLERTLAVVPRGSGAYASVAYVLAYYNYDTLKNVRRMWAHGSTSKRFRDVRFTGAENVYFYAETIYRHHQNPQLLAWLLRERSDGAGASSARWARLQIFGSYPRTVLRALARDSAALNMFSKDLAWEGDEKQHALLHRMMRSREKAVRKSAWFCAKEIRRAAKVREAD